MSPSPKREREKSLAKALEGLDISTRSDLAHSSVSSRLSARLHLGKSIAQMLKSSFSTPGGSSVRVISSRGRPACFDIVQDDGYDYNILGSVDPDDLFEEFQANLDDIATCFLSIGEDYARTLETHYIGVLCRMVFGSNMIENAGASLEITASICESIFKGHEAPEEITEQDPEYQSLKSERQEKKLPSDVAAVLHTRREIVQHAKATQHIILEVAILGKDITEELILETHGLLTHKVDCDDSDLKWHQYSGIYRSTPVVAGFTAFPPPTHVPRLMRAMVSELNTDITKAIMDGSLDPVMLSAKYCHKFVNIHPFADGNGRTCRLLLNALLLKYCGLIICLGEDADDKAKYLEIASTGSMNEMSDLDNHDDNAPAKHWKELATFSLSHATRSARELIKVLKNEQ